VAPDAAAAAAAEPVSPTMLAALRPVEEEVPASSPRSPKSPFAEKERSQSGTPAASKGQLVRQVGG
jgi:hypothetical protein